MSDNQTPTFEDHLLLVGPDNTVPMTYGEVRQHCTSLAYADLVAMVGALATDPLAVARGARGAANIALRLLEELERLHNINNNEEKNDER